jgi:predicted amidohydrolase
MVCFDWYFPEAARTLMLKGARIIAHPSNLVLPYCPDAMVTRCIENRVFAVTANRVGAERGLRYIGLSEIVDPRGRILHRASATREETRVRDVDPGLAANKRVTEMNNLLTDRRPRSYMH